MGFLSIITTSTLFAESAVSTKPPSTQNKETNQAVTPSSTTVLTEQRRKIHVANLKSFQPKTSLFFQANVGVGFLYFSGINGNTLAIYENNNYVTKNSGATPTVSFQGQSVIKGPLRYNRSPLFEYLLGYQWASWVKGAFSYQHQSGVSVQTAMQLGTGTTNAPGTFGYVNPYNQLRSDLSLDALMLKVILESPKALVVRKTAITPYVGLGVGPGWQSWTNIELMQTGFSAQNGYLNNPLILRNKYSANAAWMIDMGFHFQNVMPGKDFSITTGCKYTGWGQARNIGKISQQNEPKRGLAFPFSIKTLYSFAPYLGVQWNFSNDYSLATPYSLDGKNVNSWRPFFTKTSNFQKKSSIFTQFNVGVGFLYFSGVNGNILGYYPARGLQTLQTAYQGSSPFKGHMRYNRTPLMEYLLGYQWAPWIKGAFSYQHQGGISVQSAMVPGIGTNPASSGSSVSNAYSQLRSNLSLDALIAKLYFQLPKAMICKGVATSPYLALGVGPGWQSWTGIELEQTNLQVPSEFILSYNNNPLALRNKYSANAVWMLDMGFHFQNVYPNNQFSILLGCKYVEWGQGRNIGKVSQQNAKNWGLKYPFRIKTLYSFAPYLGVQWNFANEYVSQTPYAIDGKDVNSWKPFITNSRNLQKKSSIFTQFNVGVGFLYFSGINGNTYVNFISPAQTAAAGSISGQSSFKGHIQYNRTPLFEYLLGYQWNSCFKYAFSYQHQGGVSVQTAIEKGQNLGNNTFTYQAWSQLRSNLSLDALMAKVYFELPFPMISKGVATAPYIAVGVGPGWQSWTDVVLEQMAEGTIYNNQPLPLRNKYSANAVWMLDMGFHFQSAYPDNHFSVLLGCKYVEWGQARSIGKVSQQSTPNIGLKFPFRVKTLYSFAPYLGVQWNF